MKKPFQLFGDVVCNLFFHHPVSFNLPHLLTVYLTWQSFPRVTDKQAHEKEDWAFLIQL